MEDSRVPGPRQPVTVSLRSQNVNVSSLDKCFRSSTTQTLFPHLIQTCQSRGATDASEISSIVILQQSDAVGGFVQRERERERDVEQFSMTFRFNLSEARKLRH